MHVKINPTGQPSWLLALLLSQAQKFGIWKPLENTQLLLYYSVTNPYQER